MKNSVVTVSVNGVKLFVNEKSANVEIKFVESIDGFKLNDLGERELTQVSKISLHHRELIEKLGQLSEVFNVHQMMKGGLLDNCEWVKMLYGAKLTIKRTLLEVAEGDLTTDYETGEQVAVEKDIFLTEVEKVVFGKLAKAAFHESGADLIAG